MSENTLNVKLNVSDLKYSINSKVIVDGVSLDVEEGTFVGLVGPNGCGKSTNMKMLTGLLELTLGEAKILGKKIEAGGMEIRKKVGYMSQSFSLYEELTVKENLILHAKLYQIPKNKQKGSKINVNKR